jgi:hypothetical protein
MSIEVEFKRIGWVGKVDGKPCFDNVLDEYCHPENIYVSAAEIYKNRKEARKRFQDVTPVFIPVVRLKEELDKKHKK